MDRRNVDGKTTIHGAQIIFSNDIPDSVMTMIDQLWPEVAPYVPRWCRQVKFYWSTHAEPECAAEVVPSFTYRWATVYLYPAWLDNDRDLMRQQLLHEILHLHVEPLAGYARETFETLTKGDERTLEIVKRELTHRVEMAMQDLSMTICEQARRAET